MSMRSYADYDDATIALVHRASLTHAIALDTGLTGVPFGALLLLSRWAQKTLSQCLKRQIREGMARVEMRGPGIEVANKSTWPYFLTYDGHTRALELIRSGRELWQPPVYDAPIVDQGDKRFAQARAARNRRMLAVR